MTMEIQSAKIYIGGGSIGPEALSASSSGCSAEDTLTLRRCGLPSPNNDLFFLSIVGADDRRSIFLRGHNLIEWWLSILSMITFRPLLRWLALSTRESGFSKKIREGSTQPTLSAQCSYLGPTWPR